MKKTYRYALLTSKYIDPLLPQTYKTKFSHQQNLFYFPSLMLLQNLNYSLTGILEAQRKLAESNIRFSKHIQKRLARVCKINRLVRTEI